MSQNDFFKSIDARDWARAFSAAVPPGSPAPPEDVMLTWFASALMAMFDHINPAQAPVVLPDGSAFSVASLKETE